jgi:hypothetical protein
MLFNSIRTLDVDNLASISHPDVDVQAHPGASMASLFGASVTAGVARKVSIPWPASEELERHAPTEFEDLHQMDPGRLLGNIRAKILAKKIKNTIGEKGTLPGAVEVFPLTQCATASYFMNLLGIKRFEAGWSQSTKVVTLMKGKELLVQETPMLSFPILGEPEAFEDNRARLFHGIHIIQPRFVDEAGNPIDIHGSLPPQYLRGVINVYIPNKFYLAAHPLLKEVLPRIPPEDRKEIAAELQETIGEWEKHPPVDANLLYTQEVLDALLFAGALHEYWHAIGLHLPDKFPETPATQDKQRLSESSIDSWKAILPRHHEFKKSMVSIKNHIKVLLDVAHISRRVSPVEFIRHQRLLENQADRSSMYVFEEGLKIFALRQILDLKSDVSKVIKTNEKGGFEPTELINLVYDMEDFIAQDKLSENLATSYPSLLQALDEKNKNGLDEKITAAFQNAEQEHPYVKNLKDPKIFTDEREYFRKSFNYLRWLDSRTKLGSFDQHHYDTSRYILVTEFGMGARAVGFLKRVAG